MLLNFYLTRTMRAEHKDDTLLGRKLKMKMRSFYFSWMISKFKWNGCYGCKYMTQSYVTPIISGFTVVFAPKLGLGDSKLARLYDDSPLIVHFLINDYGWHVVFCIQRPSAALKSFLSNLVAIYRTDYYISCRRNSSLCSIRRN